MKIDTVTGAELFKSLALDGSGVWGNGNSSGNAVEGRGLRFEHRIVDVGEVMVDSPWLPK